MFDLISPFLALPELRGFWPMSSINESGNAIDLSGQARTLTNNGSLTRAIYNNLVAYADFNGSSQYFSRTDEAGLSITGALTLGGWFWIDTLGANGGLIGQGYTTGQWAYFIQKYTSNQVQFRVSANGTDLVSVGNLTSSASTWYFLVGRYTPSSELAFVYNATKNTNTSGIPASLLNSTDEFRVMRAVNQYVDGRAACCFLCAAALPDALIYNGANSLFEMTREAFGV